MIHTLKVTITVYVFAMFCYAVWYPLQVIDLANMNPDREWLGSLCYLPHGARVLMFCFFRYYSIPGLYLAEISGPVLINDLDYMDGWSIAAFASLFSVIATNIFPFSSLSAVSALGRFTSTPVSLTKDVVTIKKISIMKTISIIGVRSNPCSSDFLLLLLLNVNNLFF